MLFSYFLLGITIDLHIANILSEKKTNIWHNICSISIIYVVLLIHSIARNKYLCIHIFLFATNLSFFPSFYINYVVTIAYCSKHFTINTTSTVIAVTSTTTSLLGHWSHNFWLQTPFDIFTLIISYSISRKWTVGTRHHNTWKYAILINFTILNI